MYLSELTVENNNIHFNLLKQERNLFNDIW